MKNNWLLYSLLTVVIILTFMAKPIKKALTRGYQNKNPGNIRLTPDMWKGEIKGTDKAFKTFKTMPWGYRAIFVLLRTYIKQGYNTIEKIINTYAPPVENSTISYIAAVVSISGISKNKVVSYDNPDEIKRIVAGISFVENGMVADNGEIEQGYQLFLTA